MLSAIFSPFHPNLVIGGTYAGQILLWDTRARSAPVLKTPLSAAGHTHPVYSLALPGTQNAHNLVSASTDGTVCAWVLDMLAKPAETLELLHPGHHKTDDVSTTSLAFPDNETGTFWVSTEEGNVYSANRYDRAGSKAGLVQNEVYKGHSGPVLGIHFHPATGPIDFSDLFLTCGVDWTVKLWRAKSSGVLATAQQPNTPTSVKPGAPPANAHTASITPLHTFEEADDYVYDIKWHPHHPGMFGSVDGSGKFDIWNLNVDTEVSCVQIAFVSAHLSQVPSSSSIVNAAAPRALNKLAWEKRDGRRAAIGSTDGKLYM